MQERKAEMYARLWKEPQGRFADDNRVANAALLSLPASKIQLQAG
jgi:hypothetical protein